MEGKLLEGGDVKMSCKSADGSDPIHYKWERVLDKGKYVGKLPPLALIGKFTASACLLVLEWHQHSSYATYAKFNIKQFSPNKIPKQAKQISKKLRQLCRSVGVLIVQLGVSLYQLCKQNSSIFGSRHCFFVPVQVECLIVVQHFSYLT